MKIRSLRLALTLLSLILLYPILAPAQEPAGKNKENENGVEFIWGVKIPMRDGVKLNATIYKPQSKEPTPVIFTLTPYNADNYHDRALYFAKNGYVFALVDCRGRGNSEGRFEPFANEARDGHDIVEWLAVQPWSNGKVTMWGGSYAGFNQWATLKESPKHLMTIVPAASAYAGVDFPMVRNIFTSYNMQWLTYTSGNTPNTRLFGESSFWIEKFREFYLGHLPYKDLDKIVGNTSTYFQKWVQHSTPDDYWESMVPNEEQLRKINLPILTITGHYDGDQTGAMNYYRSHMKYASPEARDRHYLIIGPWDHAGTRTPNREFGGMKFGEASQLNMNSLHKEWYDWTLKDGKKPDFIKNRVAYFLTGAEEWKYADSLETISNKTERFYLNSTDGHANDVFHSGTMNVEMPGQSPADKYIYDPLDTRPADLESEDLQNYITDQRYALNLFGNGLVYHSEPFAEATEVTGYLKLAAWISMDVPDTDFWVTVFEVKMDGTSIMLTQDFMRARYRESLKKEQLIKPGEINRYEFDGFTFFSRLIAKGSRLRLLITSPNTIYLQKNYNSGGVVAEESGKDARTAHITLYHDAQHPSFLEIPIVKKER